MSFHYEFEDVIPGRVSADKEPSSECSSLDSASQGTDSAHFLPLSRLCTLASMASRPSSLDYLLRHDLSSSREYPLRRFQTFKVARIKTTRSSLISTGCRKADKKIELVLSQGAYFPPSPGIEFQKPDSPFRPSFKSMLTYASAGPGILSSHLASSQTDHEQPRKWSRRCGNRVLRRWQPTLLGLSRPSKFERLMRDSCSLGIVVCSGTFPEARTQKIGYFCKKPPF